MFLKFKVCKILSPLNINPVFVPMYLQVMELLKAISMGAGVLPGKSDVNGPDGELAYIRAHFERMVGSKDSETFYMLSPDGNNGPELSIFFVRV